MVNYLKVITWFPFIWNWYIQQHHPILIICPWGMTKLNRVREISLSWRRICQILWTLYYRINCWLSAISPNDTFLTAVDLWLYFIHALQTDNRFPPPPKQLIPLWSLLNTMQASRAVHTACERLLQGVPKIPLTEKEQLMIRTFVNVTKSYPVHRLTRQVLKHKQETRSWPVSHFPSHHRNVLRAFISRPSS
jgi:hypothetical protein